MDIKFINYMNYNILNSIYHLIILSINYIKKSDKIMQFYLSISISLILYLFLINFI